MSVGVVVTKRCNIEGRVYGVATYPRGVPEEHALEIKRKNCGRIIAEITADQPVTAPTATPEPPKITARTGEKPARQISAKSLTQKRRRELEKQRKEQERQQQEAQTINEVVSAPVAPDAEPVLAEVSDEEVEKIQALSGPLPAELPGKSLYEAAEIIDLSQLVKLNTDELLKVPGVTLAIIEQGRAFVVGLVRTPAPEPAVPITDFEVAGEVVLDQPAEATSQRGSETDVEVPPVTGQE